MSKRRASAAAVRARIYRDFLRGMSIFAIAEGLARDGIPSPSAHDPGRNGHPNTKAWSKSAIRVILTNARYTGRQVWNKQHKTKTLILGSPAPSPHNLRTTLDAMVAAQIDESDQHRTHRR